MRASHEKKSEKGRDLHLKIKKKIKKGSNFQGETLIEFEERQRLEISPLLTKPRSQNLLFLSPLLVVAQFASFCSLSKK